MYLQTFWSFFVLLIFFQFDVYHTSTCGEKFGGQSGIIQYSSSSKESANVSECIFLITGPPGTRINLNFIDFNFPDNNLDKCIDYLKIQDGAQEDAPTLVTLCGSGDPVLSQRTTQNNMRITVVANSTWNSTFRANYTSAVFPDHLLLMTSLNSNGKAIARLDLDVYNSDIIPVQDVGTPLAVDFDPRQGRIYWTDNSTASIKSAFLNGSGSRVEYTSTSDLGPERRGLAVDHLSRLIFYTDLNNAVIVMLSIGHCLAKLIVSTDLQRPHGIALDMINGVMFWTDVGNSPKIERANYDGSERTTIVNKTLRLPYAVTLDMSKNILYWVDAGLQKIERSDLMGSDRTEVRKLSGSHFYGLAFNRGFVYVTNHSPYMSNSTGVLSLIHKINAQSGTFTLNWTSTGLMSYAECYDEENVIAGPNGCSSSTDCPYLCIPTANKGSACLQPDSTTCSVSLPGCGGTFTSPSGTITSPGYPRNYTDNLDCIYHIVQPATYRITLTFQHFDLHETPACADDYLEILDGDLPTSPVIGDRRCGNGMVSSNLRSTKNAIRIRLKTNRNNSGTGFNISYTAGFIPKSFLLVVDSAATVLRMDPEVFSYTRLPIQLQSPVAIDYDPEEDRVYWTDDSAKEIRSAFFNGSDNQLIFSLHADASCEGLAIDYLSRLVFYTDSGNDVIGSLSITSFKQQTVITTNLDQPGAIALHLTKRFIFWTSSGSSPQLERANYDGSERRVLFTLSSQSSGLAVDLKSDLLYWADAANGIIEQRDLQGGSRKPIFSLPQSRFFALALGGDYIFITNLVLVNSSLPNLLRIRIDASEKTYKGWATTGTLKGLCLYNETTRLRAEIPITSSNAGLIAGVTGGCLAGLVIVISVVIYVVKRRAGNRTPPAVRELPKAPVEWKAQSNTSSQVALGKAVDYGDGDGDYGDYCELDDVQRQISSGERYVSLNLYLTPQPDYKDPVPPSSPSGSSPRNSRQDSTNMKM